LHELVVLAQVGDEGRLVEVADRPLLLAPGQKACVGRCAADQVADCRSWFGLLIGPYRMSSSSGSKPVLVFVTASVNARQELVVDTGLSDYPGSRLCSPGPR